jgi:hypothetical protein
MCLLSKQDRNLAIVPVSVAYGYFRICKWDLDLEKATRKFNPVKAGNDYLARLSDHERIANGLVVSMRYQ